MAGSIFDAFTSVSATLIRANVELNIFDAYFVLFFIVWFYVLIDQKHL